MTTTATGDGQAPAPQSGQEPQTAAGTTATPQAGAGQEGSQAPTTTTPVDDPVALRRELDEARREAARLRTEKKKRDDADAAATAAALSDSERIAAERDRLKAERDELAAERRRLLADAEAREIASKLGLVDHRDALALIPADQIEVDEEGKPTNLEALFKELVRTKPYLAPKPGTPTPPSTGAAAGTSGGPAPRLTADELAAANASGLSPERYAALKNVKSLDDWKKTKPAVPATN